MMLLKENLFSSGAVADRADAYRAVADRAVADRAVAYGADADVKLNVFIKS
jgi:hypothetical protein